MEGTPYSETELLRGATLDESLLGLDDEFEKALKLSKDAYEVEQGKGGAVDELKRKGLEFDCVTGDGNCLFRAFSRYLYNGDDSHYASVRKI